MNEIPQYNLRSIQKLKILLFFILSFLFCQSIFSQFTWQRLYNGPFNQQDICIDMCPATNGNFYSVGYSKKPTTQGYFIYALKLNQYGDTIWTRIIDSVSNEATSCAPTGDGSVVIVGEGHFALKLDSTGNVAWKRFYNKSGIRCYDIIKTSDGGFLACGEQLVVIGSDFRYDSYVMKLDLNGNLLWDTAYISGFDKPLYSVQEIAGEGFILSGYVKNFNIDTIKCLILKINNSGNILWEKNIKINNSFTDGKKIDKMENNFVVSGTSTIGKYFLKINSSGNIISINSALVNGNLADFKVINSNRYAITTYFDNNVNSAVIDSVGNILHQKTYNSQHYVYLFSIMPLINGDILWGGGARFGIEDADVWLIRTDSLLNAPPIGILPISNILPKDYFLYQNYPNPFNPATKIKFDIPSDAQVTLKIYDISGKAVLVSREFKKAGSYELYFDGSNLASSVYFYSMESDRFKYARKMVFVK